MMMEYVEIIREYKQYSTNVALIGYMLMVFTWRNSS